jgi:hypothetical protein
MEKSLTLASIETLLNELKALNDSSTKVAAQKARKVATAIKNEADNYRKLSLEETKK